MTKQLQFAEWMANIVKSQHYSDNEQMERAFERLEEGEGYSKIKTKPF